MRRRTLLKGGVAAMAGLAAPRVASAQSVVKIGLILPMTGPFASTGRQISAATSLYVQQHGAAVAGKTIEIVLRDDTGVADVARRHAQELMVNDRVDFVAGFGLTPIALAVAPLSARARIPQIVMAAATSIITEQSPFIVRTSFTAAQVIVPLAEWAYRSGIRKVTTLVSDYGPGVDVERGFSETFTRAGGQADNLRVPLQNPDFAPFLQRVADGRPDALLAFVPSGVGSQFMRQFVERGLDRSGIKLLAEGSVTDDDLLNNMGDPALGVITSHHYSAAHDSPENRAFVEAFKRANNGSRPNFMAVGGYDGMHLIYEGLRRTSGAGGEAFVDAAKRLSWTSPRGPMSIDPQTRDVIQSVYIRRVERVGGELFNVEFETIRDVKDPIKAARPG